MEASSAAADALAEGVSPDRSSTTSGMVVEGGVESSRGVTAFITVVVIGAFAVYAVAGVLIYRLIA
jgi:hypothetical protein